MNAIMDLAGNDQAAMSRAASAPLLYTLRRSGHKAVRFTGWQMVEAQGSFDPGAMWYDLAVYRADAGDIIVELIARRGQLGEQDLHRVEQFETLPLAATWLETYPCANDVPIPAGLAGNEAPMAATVLQAVQLRQRIARIQEDYQGLLSEVFEVLDVTEAGKAPQ